MEVLIHPSHSIGWGFLEITCICNVLGGRRVSPNAGCNRCSGLSEDKSLSKVWLDLMMHYSRCCVGRHCFLSSLASPFGPNYSQCLLPFNGKGHWGWERWKWLAQTLGSDQGLKRWCSGSEQQLFPEDTVHLPALTWRLSTICNSSPREPNTVFWPPRVPGTQYTCIHICDKILKHLKIIK